jgi:pyruvate/2-oxoglutarate/acetoin dehydrogenase E1 component
MRTWILENALASEDEITSLEESSRAYVLQCRQDTWKLYDGPIQEQKSKVVRLIAEVVAHDTTGRVDKLYQELLSNTIPFRRDVMSALRKTISLLKDYGVTGELESYYSSLLAESKELFNSYLQFDEGNQQSSLVLPEGQIQEDGPLQNGYEILNKYFDELFASNNKIVAFGEDLGKIGDVNQGFAGLQQKHGAQRIFDTGIRELTIMGQGVGMAMRGLRPIAEIQYLDYLLFGLQILSDEVATLHFRSTGKQIAPIIVRTRGHRLEGIWHSGSPMGLMINALKGFRVCVPRNMVQAIGFYNSLLQEKNPGIVVECLNGYRLKERAPSNLLTYRLPFGVPEIVREGADITIVSYGSTLRIVEEAASFLAEQGIDCEVIDVQTLLPFDINHNIVASLKKTNRILFVDEDVPGGATSFMFSEVMDKQGGYRWLDAAPKILCAQSHRPAYGSDGDYFSKPNVEDVINQVEKIMAE